MGITRDSIHKRRKTGGKINHWRKKKKYDLGRQAANTKLGGKRVHLVRVRGGNYKFRALRLETGNFAWATESVTRKSRILDVVYNASNNELVRTKTLVKNCIVEIDATPFRQWYEQHYGLTITGKKVVAKEAAPVAEGATAAPTGPVKHSKHVEAVLAARQKVKPAFDETMVSQFATGRLLACISSRPGQSGRADGYILEGKELEFYHRKVAQKKK